MNVPTKWGPKIHRLQLKNLSLLAGPTWLWSCAIWQSCHYCNSSEFEGLFFTNTIEEVRIRPRDTHMIRWIPQIWLLTQSYVQQHLLHPLPMAVSLENQLHSSRSVYQEQQSSQHQGVAVSPWPDPLVLWLLTMESWYGQAWGSDSRQVPYSENCLNWKEEGITVNINLLAQMRSPHLSELTQEKVCDSLLEINWGWLHAGIAQEGAASILPGNEGRKQFRVWTGPAASGLILYVDGPSDLLLFWEGCRCQHSSCSEEHGLKYAQWREISCVLYFCLFMGQLFPHSLSTHLRKHIVVWNVYSSVTSWNNAFTCFNLSRRDTKKRLILYGAHSS